jgi:type I restriction enzyme M protein
MLTGDLLFMRGLDELCTPEESKANRLGQPIERRNFPQGKNRVGRDGGMAAPSADKEHGSRDDVRHRLRVRAPSLRSVAQESTAHATHGRAASFTIPAPALYGSSRAVA